MPTFSTPYLFPFCIPEAEPDHLQPFGLTLEQFIKWDRRVRNWKKQCTILATASIGPLQCASEASECEANPTNPSELDLVCSANEQLAGSFNDLKSDLDGYYFVETLAGIGFNVRTEVTVQHEGLYYPLVEIATRAYAFAGDPTSSSLWEIYVSNVSGLDDSNTIEVVVDGVTGNIPYYEYQDLSVGSVSVSVGPVTVDPIEYWEHDPGDGGGPIWNSTTGTQERDPFGWQP